MKKVKAEVSSLTNGRQSPRVDQNLSKDFFFYSAASASQPAVSTQPAATGTLTVVKSYGTISVEVKEGAKLYVDNVYKGEVPGNSAANITGVESGSRKVEAYYADGKKEERTVSVTANGTGYAYFSYVKPSPASQPSPAVTTTATTVPSGMVLVEGGTFTMGDTAGGGDSDEKPTRTVTVSSFYMNKYEVTQGEYRSVMGTNPSNFKGDNLPVEQVSWYDAVEYCNKRSQKEGLTPCYSGSGDSIRCDFSANGYRLPTEAEWEYAAKGGKLAKGYKYAGSNSEGGVAWYSGNSGSKTQPVGTKASNELGIYDLSGNVWEWCWDWYGSYGSSSQTDPRGPSTGSARVGRGGSWLSSADLLRTSDRLNTPDDRYDSLLGFRPVRTK
jgi:formylglycine-generating enzyme required for sulfatase activity